MYAAARRLDLMAPLAHVGIRPVHVDVTDDVSLSAFVSQVIAESGRIDVLVNNAGYGSLGALEDVPMVEARRQFDVNLFGLARLIQLVVPHMREQHSGRIVNVSSIGGKVHVPLSGWYHATKFAVEGLSDALRLELAPFGIRRRRHRTRRRRHRVARRRGRQPARHIWPRRLRRSGRHRRGSAVGRRSRVTSRRGREDHRARGRRPSAADALRGRSRAPSRSFSPAGCCPTASSTGWCDSSSASSAALRAPAKPKPVSAGRSS